MIESSEIYSPPSFSVVEDSYQKSKQFVKSPFRYPGGKFYAAKYILPFMTCVTHDEFREPFIGGGTIFFGKDKAKKNWINDLETELVETYKVIADDILCEKLCKLIENEKASPQRHEEVKNIIPKNNLERAFKTFYLNRTSYSGIINSPSWGYVDGKSSPPTNWSAFLREANKKLKDTIITNLDFSEVIQAESYNKQVLMYLDPPYFHADQKRAYTKSFILEDHTRLAKILQKTNNLFCLSYDDCKEIRDLYAWAEIHERSWIYNTANKKGVSRDKGNELVITNYEIAFTPKQWQLF